MVTSVGGAEAVERDVKLPNVVISEIFADPLLVSDRVGEFVELVNVGSDPVQLDELRLRLPSGKVVGLLRPARPLLAPREVVVVRPSGAKVRDSNVAIARGMSLPNRGGRLELSWRAKPIDVAQWWVKWPWPKARPGVSLERRFAASDGAHGRSWRRSRTRLRVIERASPGVVHWRPVRGSAARRKARRCER